MTAIVVVYAHPYPKRSRANRMLLVAVRDLEDIELRSLYALYPDFDIDVAAEQAALEKAHVVVWQHPLYWYTAPGMLKHWFDKVLTRGWAYGDGGTALAGKICQWVTRAATRRAISPAACMSTSSMRSCPSWSRPRASAAWRGKSRWSCPGRTRSTTAR